MLYACPEPQPETVSRALPSMKYTIWKPMMKETAVDTDQEKQHQTPSNSFVFAATATPTVYLLHSPFKVPYQLTLGTDEPFLKLCFLFHHTDMRVFLRTFQWYPETRWVHWGHNYAIFPLFSTLQYESACNSEKRLKEHTLCIKLGFRDFRGFLL